MWYNSFRSIVTASFQKANDRALLCNLPIYLKTVVLESDVYWICLKRVLEEVTILGLDIFFNPFVLELSGMYHCILLENMHASLVQNSYLPPGKLFSSKI